MITEQVLAVQRMQEYIEKNISENITLADLSKAACYSPWYSYRLFVKHTSLTPSDYIRRMRLSKSALKLRDGHIKIVEAAYEAGFTSADGYTRAFYREFGCNPGEYAQSPVPVYLFTPYGVKYRNVERKTSMESVKSVYVQIVKRPKRKAIIKRGKKAKEYFAYCEEVGCDIWGLLQSIKSIYGGAVGMWLPKRLIEQGTSEYVQGAEVGLDYDGAVPEGCDVIELPDAEYLMFQSEPYEEEGYCEAIEQTSLAIEKYNPASIGYEWDNENPRIQLEPVGERGYIELRAVKKI